MAINRTAAGFLFSDDFNRANGPPGADWSIQTGAAAISGNKLLTSAGNTNVREVNSADRAEQVIQGVFQCPPAGTAAGITVRHSSDGWAWYLQFQELNKIWLFIRNPGYSSIGNWGALAYVAAEQLPFKVHCKDSFIKGWFKAGGTTVLGPTVNAGMNSKVGTGGLHHNNGAVAYDSYVRYKTNSVTITGLAAGQKLRVGALVQVEDGSGTAVLDLANTFCPAVKVEVLNADNSLFEEYTPVDGVWGGDEYELIAIAPDKPSISVTNLTDTGFTLVGSAYVHSGGSPHEETRWIVTDAFGNTVLDDSTIVNLTSRILGVPEGILPNKNYFASVAYKEAGGLWSEFSDVLQFATQPSAYPALKRTTLGWIYGLSDFSRSGSSGADIREKITDVDLSEMVVQAIMTHTTPNPPASAIAAKWQSGVNFYGMQIDTFGNASLYRCIGPGIFDFDMIDNFPFVYLEDDAIKCKLHVRETFPRQRAWFTKPSGLTLQLTGDDTDLDGLTGDVGIRYVLGSPNFTEVLYDDYAVYRNNTVTCEDLPGGFSTRIKDQLGNVLYTDAASGGLTARDIDKNLCPLVIEVLDTLGAVVFSRDDVWGGDIYEYVDAPVTPSQRRTLERAWAFKLDGHTFYVLNFTLEAALIYDLAADQWYRWYGSNALGPGLDPLWNMFRGIVWKGRVLAADMETADIWELDPHSFLDEDIDPIKRIVSAFIPFRGSESRRNGALRIIARKEDVAQPATVTMRFSNDGGQTWSTDRVVLLPSNSYSQRLEFRSLGRIRAPGRLIEIEDTGGFVRLEGADADLEGEE